ncbi:MAG: tetratricopeptide repeat protein [Syntrophomonadaceae bacterium]|nr:tetratricopeptide repeat protein [Syntrophomonadaceae bacterium]
MQEYFICVGLIFLPIGAIMAYLLSKEGFWGRNIALIEFVAFLIILTFPISMERLGTILSIVVYIALLIVTVLVFLPGRKDSTVMPGGDNGTNLPEEQPDYLNNNLAGSTVETEIYSDSSGGLIDENEKVPAAGEIAANDCPQDNILGDSCNNAASNDTFNLIPDVSEELPEENEKDNLETKSDVSEYDHNGDLLALNMDTINKESKTAYSQDKIDEEQVVYEDNTSELSHNIGALQVDEVEIISGAVENIFEDDNTEQLTGEQVVIPDIVQARIDTEESESPSDATIESAMTCTLIDRGFKSRSENLNEAAEYFEQAWQLTINQELKYLLTFELCQIYKELGEYSKAEGILEQFSVLIDERPDIIEEINEQLTRVKLLVRELNRLGLGYIPLASVPRWIRIKVAEEITTRGE